MGGIALVTYGEKILPALGVTHMPPLLEKAQQNKIGACMVLWIGGGTLSQSLTKTGAFELYFDGHLVYATCIC